MKYAKLIFCAAMGVTLVGFIWARDARAARPDYPLRFDSTTQHFGTVTWDQSLQHTFHFTNVSKETVRVAGAEAGCACTTPELSAQTFRPGEQGTLTVRFNPFAMSGPVTKAAQVRLQGFRGEEAVTVQANVNPLLWPQPMTIEAGTINTQGATFIPLTIKNTSGRPVHIRRIEGPIYADVQTLPNTPNDPDLHLKVLLNNPPVGTLSENLRLYTSIPERAFLDLPIHAQVTCKWKVSRPDFYIGFVNIGERPTASVLIHGLKPNVVLAAYTDINTLPARVTCAPAEDGTRVSLNLNLSHAPAGPLRNNVFLRTSDPTQFDVCLTITGAIQDPTRSSCCSK